MLKEHTRAWAQGEGGVALSAMADWVIHKEIALSGTLYYCAPDSIEQDVLGVCYRCAM